MYAKHFGLSRDAFALTPDPAFLFLGDGHREALAALKVGLQGRRGLMVMTGEVGTGKTTLLYSLLGEMGPEIRSAYLSNTKLSFDEMLRMALTDLRVPFERPERVEMLAALNGLLQSCAGRGETVALVIDEAQNLDDEAFEHLRLLSNYETFEAKLLQIVLVGQPELDAKLRQPSLRQVAERVAFHCHIDPLSRKESRAYIDYRLRCVGGSMDLLSPAARRLVVRRARGIPRRINILCHNAMLFAFGNGASRVSRSMVRAAVRERRRLVPGPPVGWSALRGNVFWRRASIAATALLAAAVALGALRWRDSHDGEQASAAADAPPALVVDGVAAVPEVGGAERGILDVEDIAHALPALNTEESPARVTSEPPGESADREASPLDTLARPASPAEAEPATEPEPQVASATEHAPAPMLVRSVEPQFRAVRVTRGATLSSLLREQYGTADPGMLARIRSLNPQVADPNHILAGDLLRFPEPEAEERNHP